MENNETLRQVYQAAGKFVGSEENEAYIKDYLMGMGFSEEISSQAAQNVIIERNQHIKKKQQESQRIGLGIIVVCLLTAIGLFVAYPSQAKIPLGLMLVGVWFMIRHKFS